MKRIKITETQKDMLEKFELNEANDFDNIKKKIIDDINLNYEPSIGTYREGGEYFEKPIVKNKVDGEVITPKDLFMYLDGKYKSAGEKLLKLIILDWVNGDIKNYSLSKNVGLS